MNRSIVGIVAIMLLVGAALFLILGRGTNGPNVPRASQYPSPTAIATPSPSPTPTPAGTAPLSPVGSCLVTSESVCSAVTFADYQPANSGTLRSATFLTPAGTPIYSPVTGTITASTARYIDADGQPVQSPDSQLEIKSRDGLTYTLVFHRTPANLATGQEVRVGSLLGTIEGDTLNLESGPVNLAFVITKPGAGGLPMVDVDVMRAIFRDY